MDIQIRLVSKTDFESLTRFLLDNNVLAVTGTFHPFPLTEETAHKISKQPHNDKFFVAYENGILIGLSMLRGWDEGYEIPSFGILIDRQHQNMGIGKYLTKFTLSQAKILGCRIIRLSVFASNSSAYHIYASLGFVEKSRSEIILDGVPDIKIVMEAILD